MITRRWTPLFFVPTPVLRFVLGDVWWWVPFALWLGGVALLALYLIGTYGRLGAIVGSVVLVVMWSMAGRVFLRLVRDALCLRQTLPDVVSWRFRALVDWIVPGGPSWTFIVHDDGRGRFGSVGAWARRLQLWRSAEGGVRGSHERYWTAADGAMCHELIELSPGTAIELETAAEHYAGVGFPEGLAGIGSGDPHALLFRRRSRPRAREARGTDPLQSSWISLWWAGLASGRRPLIVDLRQSVAWVETRADASFSLGDGESVVRESVGRHWAVKHERGDSALALHWLDRGLRVGFDADGRADQLQLRLPACGGLRLPGDAWVATQFHEPAAELLRALRDLATKQDLRVDLLTDAIALPDLGVLVEFDAPLPLGPAGELALSDHWSASDGDLPALVRVTVEQRGEIQ